MAGRPRIQIDWVQFDKLCGIQCTLLEIAAYFDCTDDTIERAVLREKKMNFAEYFERKRGVGKVSLRRRQFQAAMDGSNTMLVWLGKQYLGQGDIEEERPDVSNTYNISMTPEEARQTKLEIIKQILQHRSKDVQIEPTKSISGSEVKVTVIDESGEASHIPEFAGTQNAGK